MEAILRRNDVFVRQKGELISSNWKGLEDIYFQEGMKI